MEGKRVCESCNGFTEGTREFHALQTRMGDLVVLRLFSVEFIVEKKIIKLNHLTTADEDD